MSRAPEPHPFVYQVATVEQVERIRLVREAMRTAHELIESAIPSSRERSLAITKLEECSMWANKAIVLHGHLGDAEIAALPMSP